MTDTKKVQSMFFSHLQLHEVNKKLMPKLISGLCCDELGDIKHQIISELFSFKDGVKNVCLR